MAHTRSALKRIRQEAKRRARNRAVKSRMRTFVKKARLAIQASDPETALQAVRKAISEIDRAAQKGVIHRNQAARRKSRLMKLYNQMQANA